MRGTAGRLIVIIAVAAWAWLGSGRPAAALAASPAELAAHWAPIIYQDIGSDYRDDYLSRVDFDGDWDPWNNQENLDSGDFPLVAAVYYALIESETHYYITYAFFHPYDSSIFPEPSRAGLCVLHENDMEGATLTVRKNATPFGELRVIATEAHGSVYYFKPAGSDVIIGSAHRDGATVGGDGPDSTVFFPTASPDEAAVFIEADGHGVGSQYRAMEQSPGGIVLGGVSYAFKGNDGVTYYHDGGAPEEPLGLAEESVRYELRSIDELWGRRHAANPESPYCDYENYVGTRGCGLDQLAISFGGVCSPFGACAANPPWGWESDATAPRGEWFLDPAWVTGFLHLADLPERNDPGFTEYVSNRFLQGDKTLDLQMPDPLSEWAIGTNATIAWAVSDTGQGPVLDDSVVVELSRGGDPWELLGVAPIAPGAWGWSVTPPAADSCRVRISVATDCVLTIAQQSEPFSIVADPTAVAGAPLGAARLLRAEPNPFVGRTTIAYELPRPAPLRLDVYDASGRLVRVLARSPSHPAGRHTVGWDARDMEGRPVSPGVYFYRLELGGFASTRKLVLVR